MYGSLVSYPLMNLAVGQDQHSNHNNASNPERTIKPAWKINIDCVFINAKAYSENCKMIPVLNGCPSLSELIQLKKGKDVR